MSAPSRSIQELAWRFRQGCFSPLDFVRAQLDKIEKLNGSLHCFFTVCREAAVADAMQATKELAGGIDRGPLHGIPYAVTDMIDVAGLPTSCGSRLSSEGIAQADAAVVERLRAAGAIVLGKAAIFELGVGSPGLDAAYPAAR